MEDEKHEYELAASVLLDFRMMIERFERIQIKVGQWKIHYNRERVVSSGQQQLVDRSILNREFTIDRQQGVSFYGRLKGEDEKAPKRVVYFPSRAGTVS